MVVRRISLRLTGFALIALLVVAGAPSAKAAIT